MALVSVAKHSGFCFGVKEALKAALLLINKKNKGEISGEIYTCGPLIHNETVTDDLAKRGLKMLDDIRFAKRGDYVIVRSHGEKKSFFEDCEALGVNVIDATCPFVSKIHKLVGEASQQGKNILIVGDPLHPEVKGTAGWATGNVSIVKSKEDVDELTEDNYFLVCQTTIQASLLDEILEALARKGIKYTLKNTICNATSERQKSTQELARIVDAMVVIGDPNSSNSQKLFEIAKKECKYTFFLSKNDENLLHALRKCNKIGIAAGASTPERVIKEVIATMSEEKVMSMEELMAAEGYDLDGAMRLPRLGEVVNGTVHQVTEKQIVVDMGCKKDGIIPKEEVTLEGEQKLTDLFKAGDEIQAKVIKTDDGDGVITLSKKKLEVNANWAEIKEAVDTKAVLKAKVIRAVNGGVIAAYKEVSGFIPLSQLSDKFVENAEEFIGQELDVRVTRVDDKRNRAVFSHKVLAQEEKQAKLAKIWETFKVDDVVEGKVMRFTDYGAFVDLGGIDGLLHISEISWGKLKHPQEVLAIGDTVKVKILSMNEEKGKISLGLKQTRPEPWTVINEKYEVGQLVSGKVVQIKEYGAFVELEPGLDGLVHISEIAYKRVTDINEELTVGQTVEAKILEIDTEKKRISLSIKATLPEPVKEEVPEEAPAEATEE